MLGGTKEQFKELEAKIAQDRLCLNISGIVGVDLPHDDGYLKITEDGDLLIHTWCDECGEYKSTLLAMGSFEEIENILRAMGYLEDVE